MNRTKYIIISACIALVVLLITSYILNININKSFVEVLVASKNIEEGENITNSNIVKVKIDLSLLDENQYIKGENDINFANYVVGTRIEKGQLLTNSSLVDKAEYLEKTEGLKYISIPVKDATEGVSYKIKKGDTISVYYTAKKKLVDEVLKDKKKIYSTTTGETMVTCLLYDNLEIMATTNNIGVEVNGNAITDVVVKLNEEQALELANLKEQGTFTLAIN